MPPRLFLIRHGRSLANERGLIASSPKNAGDAFGLTPLGRDQVSRSVEQAREAGWLDAPILLISSPLLRARESAQIAAGMLNACPAIDARLSERCFGSLELEPDVLYKRVWAADRLDANHRFWSVESVAEVLQRAGPVADEAALAPHARTVILCTHGDVASTLVCASLGLPLEQHREVGAMETGALREMTP